MAAPALPEATSALIRPRQVVYLSAARTPAPSRLTRNPQSLSRLICLGLYILYNSSSTARRRASCKLVGVACIKRVRRSSSAKTLMKCSLACSSCRLDGTSLYARRDRRLYLCPPPVQTRAHLCASASRCPVATNLVSRAVTREQ